ncbi:hypothetical protein HK096_007759 [Nowakowskiella sp. JEL0078]|nr:hypothetical protein HK096_007759 [Nowakowskiella sp. JEL0078]
MAVIKEYELQTDIALNLLREFLGDNTELFVHELLAFARSPLQMLAYDSVVQYDNPPEIRNNNNPFSVGICDAQSGASRQNDEDLRANLPKRKCTLDQSETCSGADLSSNTAEQPKRVKSQTVDQQVLGNVGRKEMKGKNK